MIPKFVETIARKVVPEKHTDKLNWALNFLAKNNFNVSRQGLMQVLKSQNLLNKAAISDMIGLLDNPAILEKLGPFISNKTMSSLKSLGEDALRSVPDAGPTAASSDIQRLRKQFPKLK